MMFKSNFECSVLQGRKENYAQNLASPMQLLNRGPLLKQPQSRTRWTCPIAHLYELSGNQFPEHLTTGCPKQLSVCRKRLVNISHS
jgi:hypothetical protein